MGEKAVWQASLKERMVLSPLNLRRVRQSLGGAGARALAMRLRCAGEGIGVRAVRQCREPPAEPVFGTCSPGRVPQGRAGVFEALHYPAVVCVPVLFRTIKTSVGDGNAKHACSACMARRCVCANSSLCLPCGCVMPTEASVRVVGSYPCLSRLRWLTMEIPGWQSPGGSLQWTVSLLWI